VGDTPASTLQSTSIASCASAQLPYKSHVFARFVLAVSACFLLAHSIAAQETNLNNIILDQIKEMPVGGKYSATRFATIRLQSAAHFESGKFFILPSAASPSYCSGATYLVFMKALEAARATGSLHLDFATLEQLMIRNQRDGEGVWGRWNANGPGTARLFHELKLGRNFDDFAEAMPGDFMKIFWSSEVGKYERGHSVIFLGMEKQYGLDYVRFWSSNIPLGYGIKTVPRSKIIHAIFSRLIVIPSAAWDLASNRRS
jgi:hypothetical protein